MFSNPDSNSQNNANNNRVRLHIADSVRISMPHPGMNNPAPAPVVQPQAAPVSPVVPAPPVMGQPATNDNTEMKEYIKFLLMEQTMDIKEYVDAKVETMQQEAKTKTKMALQGAMNAIDRKIRRPRAKRAAANDARGNGPHQGGDNGSGPYQGGNNGNGGGNGGSNDHTQDGHSNNDDNNGGNNSTPGSTMVTFSLKSASGSTSVNEAAQLMLNDSENNEEKEMQHEHHAKKMYAPAVLSQSSPMPLVLSSYSSPVISYPRMFGMANNSPDDDL
ncbi:unnamed protein product [Amoebophrya sp. A25]|nr:unnamed protein product [Amoebophrya sp. A25]|eukprot:GSA25T00002930001.1